MSSEQKSTEQPKRIKFDSKQADALIAKLPAIFEDPKVAEDISKELLDLGKLEDDASRSEMRRVFDKLEALVFFNEIPATYTLIKMMIEAHAGITNPTKILVKGVEMLFPQNYPPNCLQNCLRLLINIYKADVNGRRDHQDPHSSTPLEAAAYTGNLNSIKALLEYKADIHNRSHNQRTLLHTAAMAQTKESLETIQFLAKQSGIDVNTQDENGSTPLHVATHVGTLANIKMLLDCGADPNAIDKNGKSPLHSAASTVIGENVQRVRILLQYGARVVTRYKNGEKESESPLDICLRTSYPGSPELQNRNKELIRIFLENGAKIEDRHLHNKLMAEFYARSGDFSWARLVGNYKVIGDYAQINRSPGMVAVDNYIVNTVNARNAMIVPALPALLTPELMIDVLRNVVENYLQPLPAEEALLNNELVQPIAWVEDRLKALIGIMPHGTLEPTAEIEEQKNNAIAELGEPSHRAECETYWNDLLLAHNAGRQLDTVKPPRAAYRVEKIAVVAEAKPLLTETKSLPKDASPDSPSMVRSSSFSGGFLAAPNAAMQKVSHIASSQTTETQPKQPSE
jgi:hypothetical protein